MNNFYLSIDNIYELIYTKEAVRNSAGDSGF